MGVSGISGYWVSGISGPLLNLPQPCYKTQKKRVFPQGVRRRRGRRALGGRQKRAAERGRTREGGAGDTFRVSCVAKKRRKGERAERGGGRKEREREG